MNEQEDDRDDDANGNKVDIQYSVRDAHPGLSNPVNVSRCLRTPVSECDDVDDGLPVVCFKLLAERLYIGRGEHALDPVVSRGVRQSYPVLCKGLDRV